MSSISYTGVAAVDELDALLTSGDFEPEHEVDTVLLDETLDLIAQARAALAALESLRDHLAAGNPDDSLGTGLAVDARVAVEALEGMTAGVLG